MAKTYVMTQKFEIRK